MLSSIKDKLMAYRNARLAKNDSGYINDLIGIGVGFGILIIVLVIIFFLGQQFYNSLTVNNSSPFYYAGAFATWVPIVLLMVFISVVVLLAVIILAALKGLQRQG